MTKRQLTRESILDGSLREFVFRHPEARRMLMSDDDRHASLRETLDKAPARGPVWVFGYGSLIWNPAFHFIDRRVARIHGYHRRFCLWTPLGRGTTDNPGLMLGLEAGGACRGVIYQIAEAAVETELDIIWRREMLTGAYRPTWVTARAGDRSLPCIAFVINREHTRYTGRLSDAQIARHIASAEGPIGPCCDYLFETVRHLAELGIRDRGLEAMARRVRAHQQSGGRPEHALS